MLLFACRGAPHATPAAPRETIAAPACQRSGSSSLCDDFRWLEHSDDPNVVEWRHQHDERTRKRLSNDPIALALQARAAEITASKSVTVESRVPLPAAGGPTREALFGAPPEGRHYGRLERADGGEAAWVLRRWPGLDRAELLLRSTATDAAPADLLVGLENSNVLWDRTRGGVYYSYTPPTAPHASRFAAREVRFHRLGTAQETDPTVVAANGDLNGSNGNRVLALLRDRYLLVEHTVAFDAPSAFLLLDLETNQRIPLPADTVDTSAQDDTLIVAVRRPDGAHSLHRFDPHTRRAGAELRRFEQAQHFLGVSRVGDYGLLTFGRGHNAAYEITDHEMRTLYQWSDVPGAAAWFYDNRRHGVDVYRGGLLIQHELVEIDPKKARARTLESKPASREALRVDAGLASSRDGTSVPYEVLRRTDAKLDGSAPLWVFAYGGFRYPQWLPFQALITAWVESGGIYAVLHARGGTELGDEWHTAAVRRTHFRTVEDIGACVRELHTRGYGSPHTTLMHGRSHGGLTVARAAIEWPTMASVVLAEVPLADMLRFAERGRGGVTEYGNPEDPADVPSLLRLSSVHAIRREQRYPAFLVTSAERDERVDPMHPAKLVAALERTVAPEVMLRVDRLGGHLGGGGDPGNAMAEALAWLRRRMAH